MITQRKLGIVLMGLAIVIIGILLVVNAELESQGQYLCELVAENPEIDMEECPAHQSSSSWLVIAGIILGIMMLGAGALMYFLPVEKAKKKVNVSKLDDEEKIIYEYIKGQEGNVYQSDLVKNTDFSKVKITRILDRMEQKGIIERKRRGMTNLVVLK